MTELGPERTGPYVRALSAALAALAPSEEHVPLSKALDHLAALDPANGGGLLDPAEITPNGMPGFAWLERARSEAELARGHTRPEPTDAELARADALDPALARRMRDRRELHRRLRTAELLPATHLAGAVRWIGPIGQPTTTATTSTFDRAPPPPGTLESTIGLAYDRLAPDGRWVRLRIELVARGTAGGAMWVDRSGRLQVDDSVRHLFTRHFGSTLGALRVQLEEVIDGTVLRLSRGLIGPFWFPGVAIPRGLPPGIGEGLLLHASTEIIDARMPESRHLDPLVPAEPDPGGWPVFRDRRFAASGRAYDAVRAWGELAGMRLHVAPISTGGPRRRES